MATNPDRSSLFPTIERRYGKPIAFWFGELAALGDERYPVQMAFLQQTHGLSRAHANALILYRRGSTSSRRYDTLPEYLASLDATKAATVRAIFQVLTDRFPTAAVVIAWNHPMLRLGNRYLFGVSAATAHLLIAPFDAAVIKQFRARLAGYVVNRKTVRVPVDWHVDADLIIDMVAAQLVDGDS